MWDKLLPKTELNLNLMRQATLNPHILAWGYLNDLFEFGANPLGPIVSPVIFNTKPLGINAVARGSVLTPTLSIINVFDAKQEEKKPSLSQTQ